MLPPKHAHEHHQTHNQDSEFFKGVVIGAVAGAALLWLFGTESGKKVKKQLEDQSGGLVSRVTEGLVEQFDEDIIDEVLPRRAASRVAATRTTLATKSPKRFFKRKK